MNNHISNRENSLLNPTAENVVPNEAAHSNGTDAGFAASPRSTRNSSESSSKEISEEIELLCRWMDFMRSVEVKLYEVGLRAFINSGAPSPSIIWRHHMNVSKETQELFERWMEKSWHDQPEDSVAVLFLSNHHWMMIARLSYKIEGIVLALLQNITEGDAFSEPPLTARFAQDVVWANTTFKWLNDLFDELFEVCNDYGKTASASSPLSEMNALQPVLRKSSILIYAIAELFKIRSSEHPTQQLTTGENRMLVMHKAKWTIFIDKTMQHEAIDFRKTPPQIAKDLGTDKNRINRIIDVLHEEGTLVFEKQKSGNTRWRRFEHKDVEAIRERFNQQEDEKQTRANRKQSREEKKQIRASRKQK